MFVRSLISFFFSQLSLEMVLFMLHICRIVQIAETSLQCVWERLRRVEDGFSTGLRHMQWLGGGFAMIFVAQKSITCSRRVRYACEDFAIPCERFATVRDGLANRFANPSQTRRVPVR